MAYNPGGGAYGGSSNRGGGNPQADAQKQLRKLFKRVDKDKTGQINAHELQQALSNGSWAPFNPETVRLMIGMFDKDGNGLINVNEFEALWKYITDWTNCFKGFDRDNSGNIDQNELTQALTSFGYRLTPQFVGLMIRKFDRSGQGNILFDDFVQLCVALQTLTASFREKDTNRNGIITVGYEEFLTMVFKLQM